MRIIIIGCEYVGKSTLAGQISRWMIRNLGLPSVRWHAHFVLPHLDRHILVPDRGAETPVDRRDDEAILQLPPFLKEQLMRYMIWRHLCNDMYRANDDFLMIDFYYGDAVYAPLYYGYGGSDDAFSDRRKRAREWDTEVMMQAPDTVLVLLRASVDAVRRRMNLNPHPGSILKLNTCRLCCGVSRKNTPTLRSNADSRWTPRIRRRIRPWRISSGKCDRICQT